jgi:putative acetyltransferase
MKSIRYDNPKHTMPQPFTLNWATPADYDDLADIVFDAVRNGPSKYTEAQRAAWVPVRKGGPEWAVRVEGQVIAIARADARTVGFMSLVGDGYIDFAYIRPDAQGSGLFRRLFAMIEDKAREVLSVSKGEPRLWTHASLMAQPAFAAVGFTAVEREVVQIGDESLKRAIMEKAV